MVYRSDLVGSAVSGDGRASCEACQIAGKKQCRISDFVRFAEPAQRYTGNAIGGVCKYVCAIRVRMIALLRDAACLDEVDGVEELGGHLVVAGDGDQGAPR